MSTGRFAPTPSGRMHLGNVWSALLAWLAARSAGGEFILRIEDLDRQRCSEENAEKIREDLRWLGLDWDREQPEQHTRTEAYEEIFEMLNGRGLVYPCYCSRADIHAANAPHAIDGRTIYSGACRRLTDAERAEKTRTPAWRLCAPDRTFTVRDSVQGELKMNLARDWGDFIIRRADGVFAYQLAVVADDIAGGVTEVVRGRDLLSSTPCQMYLYELLGAQTPRYCHVPLLTAADGRRLSKRERDMDMAALRESFKPQELLGTLGAYAGLIPFDETATAKELAAAFAWEKLPREDIVMERLERKSG